MPTASNSLARLWHLPPDAAAHGPALDAHLLLNLSIVTALFLFANALILIAIFRRRAHTPPRRQLLLETLPLAFFAILFAALALRADALWRQLPYTGSDATALQVEVTAHQFAWTFRYPGLDATFGRSRFELVAPSDGNPDGLDATDPHTADDIVTSQLVLPAGRTVDLRIRSLDVIHGFSVPAMRLKQNAVPGQVLHVHFTPTAPGDYAILCTQVCGTGHYRMAATLQVLSPAAFDAWLRTRPTFARTSSGQ